MYPARPPPKRPAFRPWRCVAVLLAVVAALVVASAAAAEDRAGWQVQLVAVKHDLVSGLGAGPFKTAYPNGIYVGSDTPPEGATKFDDLRTEELSESGFPQRPLVSRDLRQGFLVTNETDTAVARIVVTLPKSDAFKDVATGASITAKVEGNRLTYVLAHPLARGQALWFRMPPFDKAAGVTIEYVPVPK